MPLSRSVGGRSAALLGHERADPSTEGFGLFLRRGFRENAHDGLRTGWPDEHAPTAVELEIHGFELLEQAFGERAASHTRQVLLHLRIPLHLRSGLRQPAAAERAAE